MIERKTDKNICPFCKSVAVYKTDAGWRCITCGKRFESPDFLVSKNEKVCYNCQAWVQDKEFRLSGKCYNFKTLVFTRYNKTCDSFKSIYCPRCGERMKQEILKGESGRYMHGVCPNCRAISLNFYYIGR